MRQCKLRRNTDPLVKRIIILSQARSGSTLLQRILHCCIPDANINGENHNFWGHMSDSYYAWKSTCERPEAVRKYTREDLFKPCWWNEYKLQDLIRSYRRLFDEMYKARSHRVIGFKEVRVPNDTEGLQKYLDFFREMFPGCYVIFTYRDINEVVKSGWWKESDRGHLSKLESVLRASSNRNKEFVYMLKYNDLTNKEKMRALFEFIKEPFNGITYDRIVKKVYK